MRGLAWTVLLLCMACASPAKPPVTAEVRAGESPVPAVEAVPAVDAAPTVVTASPPAAAPSESAPAASPPDPARQSEAPPPAAPTEPLETGATALEVRECAARGGTMQPVCMAGQLTCVVRYRDGGKRCSDKRDCIGECLYDGTVPAPTNAVGSCQRTSDPCGCKAPIHQGSVQSALCVD